MAPLLEHVPEPLLHGVQRCRTRRCRAPSTRSTRRATSGTGARTSSRRSPTRRSRPCPVRRRDADLEVDHAPVPDRRGCPRRRLVRDRLELPRRALGLGLRRRRPDRRTSTRSGSWSIDYFEALHPFSAGGAYVNMMMDEGQERVRASYRDNYDRLARIKADYDPDNLLPRQPEHRAGRVGRRWSDERQPLSCGWGSSVRPRSEPAAGRRALSPSRA